MRCPGSPTLRLPCAIALLGLLLFAAIACDGGTSQPVGEEVAQVGEFTISRSELDLYLSLNLLPQEDAAPIDREGDHRVKSRLLDAYINEKTYLIEAAQRGIEVSDSEVDAYLGTEVEDDPVVDALTERQRRRLVRQRLLVQKLQEQHAAALPEAGEEEVLEYIELSHGRLAPRKRVRLRALRFDSAEQAQETADAIRDGETNFAEAVVNFEQDPGQGVLIELSWENLSPVIRDALDGLDAYEVANPVDFNGETFLFQLHSWLREPQEMERELIERARTELESLRRRQESEELLLSLRNKTPIVIHEDRLPFRYVR